MMEFRWYCPVCEQAFGVDPDDAENYARLWRGPDFDYVHRVRGIEHPLQLVQGQEFYHERGMVGVFVDGKLIVRPWRKMN